MKYNILNSKTILNLILAFTLGITLYILAGSIAKVSAQSSGCPTVDESRGTAEYKLSVSQSGNYSVWLKIASPETRGAVQFAANGGCYKEAGSTSLSRNQLTWVNSYLDGSSIQSTMNEGLNTLRFTASTDSLQIDQVLLTDSGCVPEGDGSNCLQEDTSSPVVNIVSPEQGSTVSGDVDLRAVVSDDDVNLSVEFYINNSLYGNAEQNSSTEWFMQLHTPEFANGEYQFEVRAKDSAGNIGVANSTFTINNVSDTPPPPTDPSNNSNTLLPTDDTFARSDKPNNTNENSTLHVDSKPGKITYIRYEIPSNQTVTQAVLALYAITDSSTAGTIYVSDGNWNEDALTWNNKPNYDTSKSVPIGSVQRNSWKEVDVTSLVGSRTGVISFAIVSDVDELARFNSKEKNSGETGPFLNAQTTSSGTQGNGENGGSGNDGNTDTGSNANPPTTANPVTYELTVTEDAFARSDQPTATARTNSLHTDSKPGKIAYFKFSQPELVGKTIEGATLRLYSLENASYGGAVYTVSNTSWLEATLNWNNRPGLGTLVGEVGSVSADRWYEVQLSTVNVDGNGLISLAISSDVDELARYQSKDQDGGSYAAVLVVTAR